jgi:hypothetical protein
VLAVAAHEEVSFAPIGSTGLKRHSGYLAEEYAPALKGHKAAKVYARMRNEPVIAGALLSIEMLLRQASWTVTPAGDSEAQVDAAAFVDSCRDDMESTWTELVSETVSAFVFGWAAFERVLKIRTGPSDDQALASKHGDGRIGWRCFATRSQDSLLEWMFDDRENLTGMIQMPPPTYSIRRIPADRLMLIRIRSRKGSPEGESLLRAAYDPWFFATRIREIEAIGVERDLAGLPKMEVPIEAFAEGASAQQRAMRAHFEQMVPRIRRGEYEGLVLPSETDRDGKPTGYRFSLVNSGGRRPIDVDAIIRRYESRMLVSLLCEFLLLGTDKVGSFALSSNKTELFSLALGAVLDTIAEHFNRVEIPLLCRINGISEDDVPRLEHGDVERVSPAEVAQYVSTLTASGHLVPDDELDKHLRVIADLPLRKEDPVEPASEAAQGGADQAEQLALAPDTQEKAQDTALNGAQISSALQIVQAVAAGQLPRDSGVNMLVEFFSLDAARADRIMGSVGRGFYSEST